MTKVSIEELTAEIDRFLLCKTPDSWISQALQQIDVLLVDHANCEKKAASTAMSMMYKYIDRPDLLKKLSKLAREELVHFDQVTHIMAARNIEYVHVSAARYASELMKQVRKPEPFQLIDRCILGAIVEARSCERFAALVPHLDEELAKFYYSLLKSEARHFKDYLRLAERYSDQSIDDRVSELLAAERLLIESPDNEFRFHSGTPKCA